jgi:hypothetical protein
MDTGTPAIERPREPKLEEQRPPQFTQEVINKANLRDVDEMTAKLVLPERESWWKAYAQHTLAHITAVLILGGAAILFSTPTQHDAGALPLTNECNSPQLPVLRITDLGKVR